MGNNIKLDPAGRFIFINAMLHFAFFVILNIYNLFTAFLIFLKQAAMFTLDYPKAKTDHLVMNYTGFYSSQRHLDVEPKSS